MIDPTPLIDLLHQHLQTQIGQAITPRALEQRELRAGTAEFEVVGLGEGVDVGAGNTITGESIAGYVAFHMALNSTYGQRLALAVTINRALESFWNNPALEPYHSVLLDFKVDRAKIFQNPLVNTQSGPLYTITADWTMTVWLETGVTP
ncbi:hypothetical protein [Deinococcus misasensis]|uniref:hypothetical protein n=1 Tax=Deinococcus misasensis TaxID=392413 RepID=UPI0005535E75|nr:hypothetical protein [Deinococcus misasensis]